MCSDAIGYTYYTNSNWMSATNDSKGDIAGVEDFEGTLAGAGHYLYDYNGNLTRDDYKGVTISYNDNNLPELIDFGSDNKISYFMMPLERRCLGQ